MVSSALPTLSIDEDELARRHARVRTALTSFDAATIATVHQFCHEVLRSLGVAGDTDAEIRAYLVQRYGDLVLLKPPFEASTLLLWATPALVVVLGGAALLRRRRAEGAPRPLSHEEQARVDALMAEPPRG